MSDLTFAQRRDAKLKEFAAAKDQGIWRIAPQGQWLYATSTKTTTVGAPPVGGLGLPVRRTGKYAVVVQVEGVLRRAGTGKVMVAVDIAECNTRR